MKFSKLLSAVVALSVATGCPPASNPDGGATGGGPANTGGGGSTGTGGGSTGMGGGNGGTGGGTGVTSDGGVAYPPEFTMLEVRASGRTGRDLYFAVKGKDRNLDAVSVWVRLLDAAGNPVMALDTNRDSTSDASEGFLTLENKRWVDETLTAGATVRGLFRRTQEVTQVGVSLVDATDLRSEEQVVPITEQVVRMRGDPCDTTFATDRCEAGLGCRGMPATCEEGLAPQISRIAFYRGTGGPVILIEGTEPEDDLSRIRFQFQNSSSQPISIDSDGDNVPDMVSFDHDAVDLAVDGTFFIRLQAGDSLDQQVPKLVATPADVAGHEGTAKIVSPSNIPVRTAGQSCDVRGFDVCGANLTCSPGILGSTMNKCALATPLRTSQCTAAPVLVPTTAGAKISGVAEGGSLWDVPTGCSTGDPKGRPEGIIKLRLVDRANKLTISTVGPETNFDTAIYLLPGCPNDTVDSMGCSDDVPNGAGASLLEVTDVPAGDYLVVVDSFDSTGGAFQLTATVE